MPETVGTLNLKIARLMQRLKVLEEQQAMSQTYPQHLRKLIQEGLAVQFQLRQLIQYRAELLSQLNYKLNRSFPNGSLGTRSEELLSQLNHHIAVRLFNGNGQREQSLCSAC